MGMFLLVVTYFGTGEIWFNVLFGTLSSGIEVSVLHLAHFGSIPLVGSPGSALVLAQFHEGAHDRTCCVPHLHVVLWRPLQNVVLPVDG